MEFVYKEHFSKVRVFINSVPVSALTGLSLTLTGANRNFYSIGSEPAGKLVPVSRRYRIKIKRNPAAVDDFELPEDGFTLSVIDSSGHTVFRGCALDSLKDDYEGSKSKVMSIVSNEKWEFKNFEYFGGARCTAVM